MPDRDFDPPPLEYATPQSRDAVGGVRRSIVIAGAVFIGVTVVCVLLPILNRPSDRGYGEAKCRSNLHQIGLGILLYCNDSNGVYPDSLATILLNEQITAPVFVCPLSNDTPSTAPTVQQQAVDMAKPGFVSYIYLGKGLTDKTVLPNQIIAYEPLANHGDGIDVLLGDGTSQFVGLNRAKKIISDANAGKRPVLLPP